MLAVDDLQGLWERSLLVWIDGIRDTTSSVVWLQGPTFFADLRQPEGRPDFAGVSCLAELGDKHLDWLARQDGFAGIFRERDGAFEWKRDFDFQPPIDLPDAGLLHFEGDVLVERGRDLDYLEHWHRRPDPRVPAGAARLVDEATGAIGFAVRVGPHFMIARGRAAPLPAGVNLFGCLQSATPAEARTLFDCEIAFGTVAPEGWRILRSSLPFRQGALFEASRHGHTILMRDIDAAGRPIERRWTIDRATGTLDDALPVQGERPVAA